MNANAALKVVIAENSTIVRNGLSSVLRRVPQRYVQPVEILSNESLRNYMLSHEPDLIIVNPTFCGFFDIEAFRKQYSEQSIKFIALLTGIVPGEMLGGYDEKIDIYANLDDIASKIDSVLEDDDEEHDEETEVLSQREKEIIVCVVKGMTNKAIADKLFISIHTVITHRRNIARKLQIHSPAGLTIYAIVNKLVDLKDVKDIAEQ